MKLSHFSAMWMDLEIVILNEVSQTEKDKCYDTTYTSNLKTGTNRLIYKQKQIHRYRNQTQRYHGGRWGENKLGDWDRHIPKKIKAVNPKRNQS